MRRERETAQPKVENPADPLAAATIVVFNERDAASVNLAAFYARKRGIPVTRLVGLDCPAAEEISRANYDGMIAEPLRRIFNERGWWKLKTNGDGATVVSENKIRVIALMRGVPLKIAATENYAGDKKDGAAVIRGRNEAAVDSELASLGYFSRQISGALNNPYFRSFTRFADTPFASLMLVCRLDAHDEATVRRMIDDAVETEKNGLWGFAYIDARGIKDGPYFEGDQWLHRAAEEARHHGLPVIEDDREETFPDGYPMRRAAIYFGWYAAQVCGPFARENFRFERGAIAVHIHSSSSASLRNPHEYWAAPLLARGAAATLGNVYEPYLSLTPNLDIFNARLLAGFTFAESAYASMRVVSWMTTFVGDPLYRPFARVNDVFADPPKPGEWTAYRDGARLWFEDRAAGEKKLRDSAKMLKSGMIYEGLGLLQLNAGDKNAALDSFQLARKIYTNSDDAARVAIHLVRLLIDSGKKEEALDLARKQIRLAPNSPTASLFKTFLPQPSPTPAKK